MAYEQHTSCVAVSQHSKLNQYVQAAAAAVVAGAGFSALVWLLPHLIPTMPSWLANLLQIGSADWTCYLLAGFVGAIFGVIAYCDWWLHDRLVCLGPTNGPTDRVAVGMLVSIEPPWGKKGLDKFDTDYSINLLPAPSMPGDNQSKVGDPKNPYGELVAEQATTKQAGLVFTGATATDWQTGAVSAILHAEFEGGGVETLKDWAEVALGVMIAALLVCLTPWGKAVAIALMILAFLALLLGLQLAPTKTVAPNTADPNLGHLTTNNANGVGADILAVLGRWVYDAGHNNEGSGWNEIHPLKLVVKVGRWRGKWPGTLDRFLDDAEQQLRGAIATTTLAAQKQPEHNWRVHPCLDGCRPPSEPPVIA